MYPVIGNLPAVVQSAITIQPAENGYFVILGVNVHHHHHGMTFEPPQFFVAASQEALTALLPTILEAAKTRLQREREAQKKMEEQMMQAGDDFGAAEISAIPPMRPAFRRGLS